MTSNVRILSTSCNGGKVRLCVIGTPRNVEFETTSEGIVQKVGFLNWLAFADPGKVSRFRPTGHSQDDEGFRRLFLPAFSVEQLAEEEERLYMLRSIGKISVLEDGFDQCAACGKVEKDMGEADWDGNHHCQDCEREMRKGQELRCDRCRVLFISDGSEFCPDCERLV